MTLPAPAADQLVELVRVRESAALAALEAAAGNASLCALSRGRTPVPAVKYHEGAAAALAEVRRAVHALPAGPDVEPAMRSALAQVHERWSRQASSPGRTGPNWAGYLTGGLDALDQLVDQLVGSAQAWAPDAHA